MDSSYTGRKLRFGQPLGHVESNCDIYPWRIVPAQEKSETIRKERLGCLRAL
jgi:hypothetical protein